MSNTIKNIQLQNLISSPDNPFKVTMDAEMEKLIESIDESGLITPIIAREIGNGRYEIVSGHRRKYACEYLGMKTIPVIVKELDRNEAVIFLVDSNLQRENILPSEKAFAYKMKLDAMNRQGKRNDLTSGQVGQKWSRDEMAESINDSSRQIQRYIRLTHLIPELLEMVDEKRIALTPAVELSYLTEQEQYYLLEEIEINDCTPSLSQACRFKKLSQNHELNRDTIADIMCEDKANQKEMFKMPMEKMRKLAPYAETSKEVEDYITKACEYYARYLQRQRDRGGR